jgi:hypothetical protein
MKLSLTLLGVNRGQRRRLVKRSRTKTQSEKPDSTNPSPQWEGQGDAFNSSKFGPAKGHFNMATTLSALPFRCTSLLVPSTRGKAKTAP